MNKRRFLYVAIMIMAAFVLMSIRFPTSIGEAQYPPPVSTPTYGTPFPTDDPPIGTPFTGNISDILFFAITSPTSPTFPTIRLDFGRGVLWYIELPPAAGSSFRGTWFKRTWMDSGTGLFYCVVSGLYIENGGWWETPEMFVENGKHRPESLVNPRIDCSLKYTGPPNEMYEYVYLSSTDTDHPKYLFKPIVRLPLIYKYR